MYTLGEKVFYVPSSTRRGQPKWQDVVKVGRKWVTFGMHGAERFLLQDLLQQGWADVDGGGYTSPGHAFITEDLYRQILSENRLRNSVRDFFSYGGGQHKLSVEQLQQIAAICGIEIEKEQTK